MKQNSQSLLSLLVLVLLFSCLTSARLLETRVVQAETTHLGSSAHVKDDIYALMGSEECQENDAGCLKRRMVAEAHLDYIYTQDHKP